MDGLTKIKFWEGEGGRSGLRLGALSGWRLGAAVLVLAALLGIGAAVGPWGPGAAMRLT